MNCIGLLLDLGLAKTSFALSQEYGYFDGLVNSIDLIQMLELSNFSGPAAEASIDFRSVHSSSKMKWIELKEFVSSNQNTIGTDSIGEPLGLFILKWLANKGLFSLLFEFGTAIPNHLTEFLTVSLYLCFFFPLISQSNYFCLFVFYVDNSTVQTWRGSTSCNKRIFPAPALRHCTTLVKRVMDPLQKRY